MMRQLTICGFGTGLVILSTCYYVLMDSKSVRRSIITISVPALLSFTIGKFMKYTYILEALYINNDGLHAEVLFRAPAIAAYCKETRSSLYYLALSKPEHRRFKCS